MNMYWLTMIPRMTNLAVVGVALLTASYAVAVSATLMCDLSMPVLAPI